MAASYGLFQCPIFGQYNEGTFELAPKEKMQQIRQRIYDLFVA
jgi:hypothetical protein